MSRECTLAKIPHLYLGPLITVVRCGKYAAGVSDYFMKLAQRFLSGSDELPPLGYFEIVPCQTRCLAAEETAPRSFKRKLEIVLAREPQCRSLRRRWDEERRGRSNFDPI